MRTAITARRRCLAFGTDAIFALAMARSSIFSFDCSTAGTFGFPDRLIEFRNEFSRICALRYCDAALQQDGYMLGVMNHFRRPAVQKITMSIIAAAAFATSVGSAAAAELPSYAKAGLPVSPVQMQVLGSQQVEQAFPVTTAASPVQLGVLKPRGKMKTAQGQSETIGRTAQ